MFNWPVFNNNILCYVSPCWHYKFAMGVPLDKSDLNPHDNVGEVEEARIVIRSNDVADLFGTYNWCVW